MKNRFVMRPLAIAATLLCATSASAVSIDWGNGITGSFDSTFSWGTAIRKEASDPNLYGLTNGGTSRSVNEDEGDRAYQNNKSFSNALKGTHELELKYQNVGVLLRGTYFYDFVNNDKNSLGQEGKKRLGHDARGLDSFVYGKFDLGGSKLNLRAGNQVISWGESTYITNGINVINAADLSKLRIPGSELKEAFIPVKSLWGSLELTENASVEAFYLLNSDKIKLDPRGAYFSNNDFAADDGWRVFVGFGRRKDLSQTATNPIAFPAAALANPTIAGLNASLVSLYGQGDPAAAVWAPRASDRPAKDGGQSGVAFHYLAPALNSTEFGLYYMNYHSRIPFFSGIKGKPTSAITGGPLTATLCSATLQAAIGTAACDQARTDLKATYFAEYPEGIKLTGVSFNTQAPGGIALQGEYSYRSNQPLQIATPELLLAALGAPNLITGFTTIPGTVSAANPFGASAAALVPDGTELTGFRRVKMSQLQMTATKSVPNVLNADQLILIGEFGYTKYHNLSPDLKFNGPAVFLPATAEGAAAGQSGSVQPTGFVTGNSWGYRLAGRVDYPNLFLDSNVSPRFAFSHDVSGVSQTFNEGVKSFSLGVAVDYQKKILFDASYNSYFGGRVYCGTDTVTNAAQTSLAAQIALQGANFCSSANPLKDRDFFSVSVSYSF